MDRESFPAEAAALFSIGIPPEAKGLFMDPLEASSLSPLGIITESTRQASQIAIIPWDPCMGPTSRKRQSLPQGQELSSDRIQSFPFSSGNRSRRDATCYFSVPGAR